MIHRARSLVTVLALSIPSIAYADKPAPDPAATFLRQDKYSYCDLKLLSALWKQSQADAKVRIGVKIQAGKPGEKFLDGELAAARKSKPARCTFKEAGFTYGDAAKLAKLWTKTASEAQQLAEDKIAAGGEKTLRKLLKKPAKKNDPVSTFLEQDKYTYCDVKLLAARWKASASNAKARIGLKLQTGNTAFLDSELVAARSGTRVRCTYLDAGFSFEDIERIAKAWKLPTDRAKAKVEAKVAAAGSAVAHEAFGGAAAQNPNDAEIAVFLRQNTYTYCDAKMLAGMWKKSVDDAKAFIGAKIQARSTEGLKDLFASARANAKKVPSARCTFAEAGFTFEDAQKLAKLWGTNEGQAKAAVEQKILAGAEASVRQQLGK